jgi:hypothetical protein
MRKCGYFEERKIDALIRFALGNISIAKLRGLEPRLTTVYESYAENVNRTYSLATYTPAVILSSLTYGQFFARAVFEEFGTFSPSPQMFTREATDNVKLRSQRMVDLPPQLPGKRTLVKKISSAVRSTFDRVDKKTTDGLDAVMPALIVLAWTAFESLSEDLLIKAISIRPKHLPPTTAFTKPRKLPAWEQMTLKGKIQPTSGALDRPLQPNDLGFRAIRTIRDSYWRIFSQDGQAVNRVLRHRSLDTLHALRNVLVHKGGYADPIFVHRVAGLPRFATITVGDRIDLDFAIVRNLIVPAFSCGITLLGCVNRWILRHPQ